MNSSADAGMTPDQLAEAKQYGRLELRCGLADKAIDLLFLAAAAILLARPLDAWLQTVPWLRSCWSLRLAALFLVVTALHIAVSFPLSFYSGFSLERRFHLSTLSWAGWLWRYVKRNLLAAGLGAAMMLGLYWLIWTVGGWWWLAAAGMFFLVSVALGQLFPVLILPLFYKIQRLDRPELAARIARLAEGTGLAIEGVYRLALSDETVKANAMLAGLGRTRRVLLGDTLLDAFSADEIEVILAHEIGHHVFGHIRKMIVGGMLASAAGFFLCDRLLGLFVGGAVELCEAAREHSARADVHSRRFFHAFGAAGQRDQPPPRAAMRPLRIAADRIEGGIRLCVSQVGGDEQGQPRSASAGCISLSQPPANRPTAGDGGPAVHGPTPAGSGLGRGSPAGLLSRRFRPLIRRCFRSTLSIDCQ